MREAGGDGVVAVLELVDGAGGGGGEAVVDAGPAEVEAPARRGRGSVSEER